MNTAGEIVMLLGASGAGKTTWWQTRYAPHQVLSLDQIRLQLTDDIADQDITPVAVELRRILLEHRAQHGRPTVIDSTNTRIEHRSPILAAARRWHRPTIAVVFHTPLEVCLRRQGLSERTLRILGQPNGRATPAGAVITQHDETAQAWHQMSVEVDCVVHVSPDGTAHHRVGDIPRPHPYATGPDWLTLTPAVPSAAHLPWRSPYLNDTTN